MSEELPDRWVDALALDRRAPPDLFKRGDQIASGPHAAAIETALYELKLTAVFCIEGVPTIGFLRDQTATVEQIDKLHRSLWNQGLMSLLLVIRDGELLAYSLVRMPLRNYDYTRNDPRLIETLSLTADALKIRGLIDSAESGRYWYENEEFFDPEHRVDSVLLKNLTQSFRNLKPELGVDGAQALLMQTIFISYLEDRKIIGPEAFKNASRDRYESFIEILNELDLDSFQRLFVWLARAFNGNVFNAPCAFELDEDVDLPEMKPHHLSILSRFRHGQEDMETLQLRFWGYDFRYIPVALISAVYDRFLKEEDSRQNSEGAFYTPMFLADLVVNQLWSELSDDQKLISTFLDPACGSGIFLVRIFQRLVEDHCAREGTRTAKWSVMIEFAERLYGADINSSAVRITAFSLYIALLERADPPDLQSMIKRGRVLPSLYRRTLRPANDFFLSDDIATYDVVVGNPPWKGRPGQITSAQKWAKETKLPIPANDIAWAFIWKALKIVQQNGRVAFLLPAMGVLHNISEKSESARGLLLTAAQILRIINLSDLCFQLFDGAQRPTALIVLKPLSERKRFEQLGFWSAASDISRAPELSKHVYKFEYWAPKADLNLRIKRALTLSRADRITMRSDQAAKDPTVFKRRLWTRGPDEKLLQYLKTIERLRSFVKQYKNLSKDEFNRQTMWAIGQGFKPVNKKKVGLEGYDVKPAENLRDKPFLSAANFPHLVLPNVDARPFDEDIVHRTGFGAGFIGPHILIPQGVERAVGRVRAAYSEQSLTFQDSIQSLVFPEREREVAKLLTAVLNSRLAAWFFFHETANLGTDRAKVLQSDLLSLPFADDNGMPDPALASKYKKKIIERMDELLAQKFLTVGSDASVLNELDGYVYQYYGLSEDEAASINDAFDYLIPAMQPRRSAPAPKIWSKSGAQDQKRYIQTLEESLKPWFRTGLCANVMTSSEDLTIVRLRLKSKNTNRRHVELALEESADINEALARINMHIKEKLPGNVYLHPDLRIAIEDNMYLIKPNQMRFWLKSAAIADAEQIASELQAAVARRMMQDNENA